ncbi:hypothetical protein NHQ30_006161 [Ciborinia camelliae]|nr:hypothetical protein NHQ30_006161 [Ciborinia camelliae]
MDVNQPPGEKVQIDIGQDSYDIDVDLLSKDMDFFGNFDRNSVAIDSTPEMFEIFVMWLYTRRFIKLPTIKVAVELWIFADKISCQKLQNFTMDFIQDFYQSTPEWMTADELEYTFEATNNGGSEIPPLETFCAAQLHYHNSFSSYLAVRDILSKVPAAIVPYLLFEANCDDIDELKNLDPSSRTKSNLCRFHKHDGENDFFSVCESKPNDH